MNISVPNVVLKDDPSFDVQVRRDSDKRILGDVFYGFQVNVAKLVVGFTCIV